MLQLLAIVDPFDNGGTSSPWAMKLPDKKRGLEIQAEWPCREREREREGVRGRCRRIHQNAISIEPLHSSSGNN